MPYFYDNYGWQTSTPNDERGTLVEPPAEADGLKNNWTGVAWVQAPYLAPVLAEVVAEVAATVYTKMTKRAFLARFPKTADGISSKYALASLFLMSDGYAASLGVVGATLYSLRALILEGQTALNSSLCVDYAVPDAAKYTALMSHVMFPEVFRLTTPERSEIMDPPITEAEAYK